MRVLSILVLILPWLLVASVAAAPLAASAAMSAPVFAELSLAQRAGLGMTAAPVGTSRAPYDAVVSVGQLADPRSFVDVVLLPFVLAELLPIRLLQAQPQRLRQFVRLR